MLQFAEIFYYVMYQVQHRTLRGLPFTQQKNYLLLYLKTLLYFINYYQDEAYISNEALYFMMDS